MNKKLQKGISIVELTISITITIVLVGIIIFFQNHVINQQNFLTSSYLNIENINRNVQEIIKQIRNCQSSDSGAYPFELLSDQEIIFYSNTDDQDDIEKIHYYLQDTDLIKVITKPTTSHPIQYLSQNEKTYTIAENVVNFEEPLFYYYDEDYIEDQSTPLEQTQRLTQTRLVAINLIVNVDQNTLKQNYNIKSYAQIRALKDNL